MSLAAALHLAAQGFHVFPLIVDGKFPAIEAFPEKATRDEAMLRSWFHCDVMDFDHGYNVGIYTGRFGDDPTVSLCVIDVDDKGDKHGSSVLQALVDGGLRLPDTYTQTTASGGRHLVFASTVRVGNAVGGTGSSQFAAGLDIRGTGGFIVGAGSSIGGKRYTADQAAVAVAPDSLIALCAPYKAPRNAELDALFASDVDENAAEARAVDYLTRSAPQSIKGQGGDATAFQVASRLKDFGVSEQRTLELMMQHWFGGSGWSADRLAVKIANAFQYGRSAPGSAAPEAMFKPVEAAPPARAGEPEHVETQHPSDKLHEFNRNHAWVGIGSKYAILQESIGPDGSLRIDYLTPDTFTSKYTGWPVPAGKTTVEAAECWLKLRGAHTRPAEGYWRRTYEAVWFMPEKRLAPQFYNLWRGFAFTPHDMSKPVPANWQRALDDWKAHLLHNLCNGNAKLAHWTTGWFAQLVQKPYEKPLVALAISGRKGTGKNAVIQRVADLISPHYYVADNPRDLVGQFNAHLEACLLLVCDEAFWGGDKKHEGILKGFITGDKVNIERKGKDIISLPNLTRMVLLGNESHIFPASSDERRITAYEMAEGRMRDKTFFENMKNDMRSGGGALLLRYLLDFDLSTVDVNEPQVTAALLDQKLESLGSLGKYWHACLTDGVIVEAAAHFDVGEWPKEVSKKTFRDAFAQFRRQLGISSQSGTDPESVGKWLAKAAPSISTRRVRTGNEQPNVYVLPSLEVARKEWETHLGHTINWS